MRELLDAVAAGDLSPAEAEARLRGYATTGAGRFDAGREERRGVPEAILAAGKSPSEVAALTRTALETTGHALVTRVSEADVAAVTDEVDDWPVRECLLETIEQLEFSPPDGGGLVVVNYPFDYSHED
jgi:NCAIR mutase (PurE)-related protein